MLQHQQSQQVPQQQQQAHQQQQHQQHQQRHHHHNKPTNQANNFQKRIRTCYRQYQLEILEEAFKQNSYPSPAVKDLLASKTCIDVSRIQVWFQNRRAKHKKQLCQTFRGNQNNNATTNHHHHHQLFYGNHNWLNYCNSINLNQHHQTQQQVSMGISPPLNSSTGQLLIGNIIDNDTATTFYSNQHDHENISHPFELSTVSNSIPAGQQIISQQHTQDHNALSNSLVATANFRQHIQEQQQQHQNQNQLSQYFNCTHFNRQLVADVKPSAKYHIN